LLLYLDAEMEQDKVEETRKELTVSAVQQPLFQARFPLFPSFNFGLAAHLPPGSQATAHTIAVLHTALSAGAFPFLPDETQRADPNFREKQSLSRVHSPSDSGCTISE